MTIDVKEVGTLSEFVSIISEEHKRLNRTFWFRGQSKEYNPITKNGYKLVPSIFRDKYSPDPLYYESIFLNSFKARAITNIETIPRTDLEWMFLMQHYDLPTRLLDWSEQAMIALLFAVNNHSEALNQDAIVWVLDPLKLNENHPLNDKKLKIVIPNIIDDNEPFKQINKDYMGQGGMPVNFPIAILPPHNNRRIIAQKGVFTLFPGNVFTPLEEIKDCELFLWKIKIKCRSVGQIKTELKGIGINEVSLFPELDKIALGIINTIP